MNTKSGEATVKRIIIWTIVALIVLVAVIAVFTSTVFGGSLSTYTVMINDNGSEFTVLTDEDDVNEILDQAGISLNSNDKVDISSFIAGTGGEIVINRLNTIYVLSGDDETMTQHAVYSSTVEDAMIEANEDIDGCILNYDLDAPVENGMVVSINHTMTITVEYNGEKRQVLTSSGTVEKAIGLAGFHLASNNTTSPALDKKLSDGMKIKIHTVETKTVTETEVLEYSTKKVKSTTLENGKTKVKTKGQNGKKEVVYEITYIDGEEDSRTVVSENVLKEPVEEVVEVGTAKFDTTPNGVKSKNGFSVGQTINGVYTHYCACVKCCGKSNGITASGLKVHNGMVNPYYVALNWLPLGSIIEINGVQYLVADRGGSRLSKTGRVDIYTPAGHQAALKAGTGSCKITIDRIGW